MIEPVDRLCRRVGYRFVNPALIQAALTHRSVGSANNERLEFLGDSILGFVVADELYQQLAGADEGQLSRLRAALVKRETLARVARSLELGNYLQLGQGELRSGGHARDSILADALEAIFAAIYLDGGFPAVRKVILGLFEERIAELSADSQPKDPKTRLQELLQSRRLKLPEYEVIEVQGEAHDQTFLVRCQVESLGIESLGSGSSRRRGEQAAAEKLLSRLVP